MEKLSSHFMGHFATFPSTWYCTKMWREYMLLSRFGTRTGYLWKRLYQWFNRVLLFGTILPRASGRQTFRFSGVKLLYAIETIAHNWQQEHLEPFPQKNPELLKIQALAGGACP
jgi:hypothetical protein